MKKYCIMTAVLILVLSIFAGCGCRRRVEEMMPTDSATETTYETITVPTTEATSEAPLGTDSTNGIAATDGMDMVPDGVDPDNNTETTNTPTEGETRSRNSRMK